MGRRGLGERRRRGERDRGDRDRCRRRGGERDRRRRGLDERCLRRGGERERARRGLGDRERLGDCRRRGRERERERDLERPMAAVDDASKAALIDQGEALYSQFCCTLKHSLLAACNTLARQR